ncbi:DUF4256 domain-containing protein [Flavobacterium sp. AED]|uniref:DUF4256 domain-containing protein n=1 Tax=Flavobacterium sp. AED TaxID=1423323 RepID=UPI00057EE6C6|nr:hypothetical protein OA85_02155 [Flavobacterium sp. AED]
MITRLKGQSAQNEDKQLQYIVKKPSEIRKLGGALFTDFRYGTVFLYHNSAPSYYCSQGIPWFAKNLILLCQLIEF